jgi:hypothetical protein
VHRAAKGKHRGEATHAGQELFLGHRYTSRHLRARKVLGAVRDACRGVALYFGSTVSTCRCSFILVPRW